jgi:hypothetical protein
MSDGASSPAKASSVRYDLLVSCEEKTRDKFRKQQEGRSVSKFI